MSKVVYNIELQETKVEDIEKTKEEQQALEQEEVELTKSEKELIENENIELEEDDKVKEFVGTYKPEHYLLNEKEPIAVGPLDVQPFLFEHKAQQAEGMKNAKNGILEVSKDFEKMTGRKYGLFEEYKLDDAEVAIVCMNSTAGTTKYVVDELRNKENRSIDEIFRRMFKC